MHSTVSGTRHSYHRQQYLSLITLLQQIRLPVFKVKQHLSKKSRPNRHSSSSCLLILIPSNTHSRILNPNFDSPLVNLFPPNLQSPPHHIPTTHRTYSLGSPRQHPI